MMMQGPQLVAASTEQPESPDDGPPPLPTAPPDASPAGAAAERGVAEMEVKHSGMLLIKKVKSCPGAHAAIGTLAQGIFWDTRYVELRRDALSCWRSLKTHSNGQPAQRVVSLSELEGLAICKEELILRFRTQQRSTGRKQEPALHLRAPTCAEAEAWAAALRSVTAERLNAMLPAHWDVGAIVNAGVGTDASGAGLVNKEALPEDLHFVLQRMLDHSFICKKTKDRRGKGLPLRLEVSEVVKVENGKAWIEYSKARERIFNDRNGPDSVLEPQVLTGTLDDQIVRSVLGELDSADNEQWLFHGTTSDAVQKISDNEFSLDFAGSHRGTLYGKGVYMAECSSKADEYAEEDHQGRCTMLLCRVALGRILVNAEPQPGQDIITVCKAHYNSLCGDRWRAVGTYREFVLYESAQVYPAYIIHYRRINEPGLSHAMKSLSSQDFTYQEAALDLVIHTASLCEKHPDPDVRYRISLVLSTHAETAVPVFCICLKDDRLLVRRTAATSLRRMASNAAAVSNGCHLAPTMGQNSRNVPVVASAVPPLVARLGDEDECLLVRQAAAGTLAQLGRHAAQAVPDLVRQLKDRDAGVRASSAVALGQIGPAAAGAIPMVTEALADPNAEVSAAAAASVGQLGKYMDPAAVPDLVTRLEAVLGHDSERMRREAASALGQFGGDAVRSSTPLLIERLRDSCPEVRCATVATLGKLGVHAAPAVPGLMDCVKDRESQVRTVAAQALGHLASFATLAVPLLVNRGLKDPCDDVRIQAATALGHFTALGHLGAHEEMVKSAMTERLKDTNPKVRQAASFGLTKPMTAEAMREMLPRKSSGKNSDKCPKDQNVLSWRRTEVQMKAIQAAYANVKVKPSGN
mmetsp:Transcript_15682/g.28874  ORF Transcript_15682/g.28874 Transcript_15682/m.28874 type:complete len:864 (+) Transcript_15682:165-2756(+)